MTLRKHGPRAVFGTLIRVRCGHNAIAGGTGHSQDCPKAIGREHAMAAARSGFKVRLEPQDEYTHTPDAASNYNESMYFNVFDPARKIGGWFRLGNRPNEGRAEMTVCLYLPDGRVAFMFGRPKIADNKAMNAGGMKIEVVEP